MNATDKQVGGTHYKTAIQPVQYIHANGLNFFEGNVVKYITRHRKKGGKEDLKKAIHYIEMLIQFEYPEPKTFGSDNFEHPNAKSAVNPLLVDNIEEDGTISFANGEKIDISDLTPIGGGLVEWSKELKTMQVNIPDDAHAEVENIYPFKPDGYITNPKNKNGSCIGCMFSTFKRCSAPSLSIAAYCRKERIIYTSLKQ